MKEYLEDNKEKVAEYRKEYAVIRKETYTCECGETITKTNGKRHHLSIPHQKYLKSLAFEDFLNLFHYELIVPVKQITKSLTNQLWNKKHTN